MKAVVKHLIQLLCVAVCYFYLMPVTLTFASLGFAIMYAEKENILHQGDPILNMIRDSGPFADFIHRLHTGLSMLLICWLAWVVYGLAAAVWALFKRFRETPIPPAS